MYLCSAGRLRLTILSEVLIDGVDSFFAGGCLFSSAVDDLIDFFVVFSLILFE